MYTSPLLAIDLFSLKSLNITMKRSQLLGRTLRESHLVPDPWTEIALRAALIRLVDGQVLSLPLGERVIARLMDLFRSIPFPGQEVRLQPGLVDEGWSEFLRDEIQSYRQLPVTLFTHRMVKSIEPAQGLARPSWRRVIQWLRMGTNIEDLSDYQDQWKEKVEALWSEVRIAPLWTEWSPREYGWSYLHDNGPDKMLSCTSCSYIGSSGAAQFRRQSSEEENLVEMTPIATPEADTIQALAEMLSIKEAKTLKAIFLTGGDERLVLVVVRGDLDVSLPKVSDVTGLRSLQPAREEVIRSSGAEPGYASPIGLDVKASLEAKGLLVIGDLSIEHGVNFVAGANKPGFHMSGVNYPRDFSVTLIADIALAKEGDRCPTCGEALTATRGIYLGGWKRLAEPIRYTSDEGLDRYTQIGLGTIFLESILSAILAEHNDDLGLIWPVKIAPYDVYLVELKCPQEAEQVVRDVEAVGLSVLHDDRKASPGVKFSDADLIGLPVRLTVSRRSLEQGGLECAVRGRSDRQIIPLEGVGETILAVLTSVM
jgi:prolyl-tRNA synthetase